MPSGVIHIAALEQDVIILQNIRQCMYVTWRQAY